VIDPRHFQEWVESGVDFDYLFYDDRYKIPQRNDNRLTDGFLKKYRHLKEGGWYWDTLDPLTRINDFWGCYKPNRPRVAKPKKHNFGVPVTVTHRKTGCFLSKQALDHLAAIQGGVR
jgi:hypothetical protein